MVGNSKVESILTAGQVARLLCVSDETVRQLSNKGIIRPCEVASSGEERFRLKDIASYLATLKASQDAETS